LSAASVSTSSKNAAFTENVPLRYWAYYRNPPTQPKQINQLLNPSPRQLFKFGMAVTPHSKWPKSMSRQMFADILSLRLNRTGRSFIVSCADPASR